MNIPCLKCVFLVLCSSVAVESFFTLIGPRTVQYKSIYKCILTSTYKETDEAKVTVSLTGKSSGYETDNEMQLRSLETREIEFNITRHNIAENFTLKAEFTSKNGSYVQNMDIFIIQKRYSVFIQTDKPVYKPGDEILYRILVLDSDLKPYHVDKGKLAHAIYDGSGNVVPEAKKAAFDGKEELPEISASDFDDDEAKDETDAENTRNNLFSNNMDLINKRKGQITNGLYSFSHQLSEEPIEGTWSINVTIDNEYQFATIQHFKVERFKASPRFQVFIETGNNMNRDEDDILLNIYANYTFGKYVAGKATVKGIVYDLKHPEIIQKEVTKYVEVETKSTVSFSMASDLNLLGTVRLYGVRFIVEFEEMFTKHVETANKLVKVQKFQGYLMKIIREEQKFKPGSPYAFEVQVTKANGDPATKPFELLKLFVSYHYKPLMCYSLPGNENFHYNSAYMTKKLLVGGKARFSLDIPENTTAISIKAQYVGDSVKANILRHYAVSREYMRIEHVKKTNGLLPEQVGERFKIKIKLSEAAYSPVIHYLVVSSQEVVAHGSEDLEFIDRTATIGITATSKMSPTCNVIVYYIQPAGEIVYDQVKVDIPTSSLFTMTFYEEIEEETPARVSKLITKAPVGSFVFLLGVDLSAKLLGHGNDIDIPRVSADKKLHESSSFAPDKGDVNAKYSDFSRSNAFIITNAIGYEKNCSSYNDRQDSQVSTDDSPPESFNDDSSDENSNEYHFEDNFDTNNVGSVYPETWIFKSFEIDSTGKFTLDAVVPDKITTFVVSGFAVHPEHGLLIAEPRKITVFKEFFAKLYVPYSIRLGEVLKVDVSVFNFLLVSGSEIQATVTLNGQHEFEFVDVNNETCTVTGSGSGIQDKSRTIPVPYGNGAASYFLIRAKKVGLMKLSITTTIATSNVTDYVEKFVKVEREGYQNTEKRAIVIDLRNEVKKSYSNNFQFSFPEQCLGNSIQITASVIGDLLGPALANVHNLLKMPNSPSEVAFKIFIQNVVAMKYLKAVGKLSGDYKTQGEKYLRVGYQELLKRRQSDGSFNMWGEKDRKCVWLTAYVAKVFALVQEFIPVNIQYIAEALDFVKGHQNKTSGGFLEESVFRYIYISKTATRQGLALNAFIAIALMENSDFVRDFKYTIDKTMTYLEDHTTEVTDSATLAVLAYAFALHRNFVETMKIFSILIGNSIQSDTTMFWEHSSPNVQVETAAYVVLALVKINKAHEVMPVVNWLISQRQASGGFHATTDTIIGVQALATYATAVYSPQKNLHVELSYENRRKAEFNITEDNALMFQTKKIKSDARRFTLSVDGKGFAFFQLTYSCDINVPDPKKSFEITTELLASGSGNSLHLRVCASFVPTETQKQSGLTVIEVYLPSGYEYDQETEILVRKIGVKRIETSHQKTVIVLYLNSMSETSVCADIKTTRKTVVENLQNYPVKIYDYYNKSLRASSFYSVRKDKKCGF